MTQRVNINYDTEEKKWQKVGLEPVTFWAPHTYAVHLVGYF